jgi:hypothetical protein
MNIKKNQDQEKKDDEQQCLNHDQQQGAELS